MNITEAERRRNSRLAASHSVTILTADGRKLVNGRTGNISPRGLFVIARFNNDLPEDEVLLELKVPTARSHVSGGTQTRSVRLRARIVRTVRLGQLVGLGLQLIDDLP